MQLPIFNEQFVVERLIDCVCKLEYPLEKLDIQVLDDSTDETVDVARGIWWTGTRRWAIPSATTIAPIAKASRRVRWTKA